VQKLIPQKIISIKAISPPPNIIHIIFPKRPQHPLSSDFLTMSLPKGHITKQAILKHCFPHGIPARDIQ